MNKYTEFYSCPECNNKDLTISEINDKQVTFTCRICLRETTKEYPIGYSGFCPMCGGQGVERQDYGREFPLRTIVCNRCEGTGLNDWASKIVNGDFW